MALSCSRTVFLTLIYNITNSLYYTGTVFAYAIRNLTTACTTHCSNFVKLGKDWQAHRMKIIIDTEDFLMLKMSMNYEFIMKKEGIHLNDPRYSWPDGTKPYIGSVF